jgi:succinyl-diaminopimelate desuccinylase
LNAVASPNSISIRAEINRAWVIEALTALVRLDSANPPGIEAPVAELIAGWLAPAGLDVAVVPVTAGRANVIARLRGCQRRPALMLCGHLDTVPFNRADWTHDPLAAKQVDGRLYGRGAADMKGGLAAMLGALLALAQSPTPLAGDVMFAGTVGEEVDCLGAEHLLASGGLDGVGALVIGEPTGLGLGVAHRGAAWLRLTTYGKAAHASTPHLGVNAIGHMCRLLAALEQHNFAGQPHPLLPPATQSVGTIHAGASTNVVPDRCEAQVDIRLVPGQTPAAVTAEVERLIAGLRATDPAFRAEVAIINQRSPVATDAALPLVVAAQAAAENTLGHRPSPVGQSYFTDASVLVPATGVPTLIIGPGEAGQAHQADEWVSLEKVIQAARIYTRLAQDWLAA